MNYLIELIAIFKKKMNLKNDKEIAEKLKISGSYLCDIKKGKRRISNAMILKITKQCAIQNEKYLIASQIAYVETIEEKIIWKNIMKNHCETQKK